LDDSPSIKLGIVMEPYAPDFERATYAIRGVAAAFAGDPSPVLGGLNALVQCGPQDRVTRIEVMALDFFPNGHCDMTVYARLVPRQKKAGSPAS
jgi:hypothetical protein